MSFKTADLCDKYSESLQIAEPMFADFGGLTSFSGEISTIKCYEDNSLVRSAFEINAEGKVLVIDGGGSLRCALIGDQLAKLAEENGWSGAIVYGCIRDSEAISEIDIGLKALNTHPLKSVKRGQGEQDISVHFADITFTPGQFVYADEDGIVVSATPLL